MSEQVEPPAASGDRETKLHQAMRRLLDRPADPQDVRAATLRVRQSLAVSERDQLSLLAFRVNEELLGLAGGDVIRVTHMTTIHRIPHRSNAVIRGLCNIQGELLICGSLPALLGMPAAEGSDGDSATVSSNRRRIVVIGRGAETWAVVVDEVLGVVRLEAKAFLSPPATVQNDRQCFTRHLAPLPDGRLLAVLDARRLDSGFKAALT
jgi:chemotaxis signal transduction protein